MPSNTEHSFAHTDLDVPLDLSDIVTTNSPSLDVRLDALDAVFDTSDSNYGVIGTYPQFQNKSFAQLFTAFHSTTVSHNNSIISITAQLGNLINDSITVANKAWSSEEIRDRIDDLIDDATSLNIDKSWSQARLVIIVQEFINALWKRAFGEIPVVDGTVTGDDGNITITGSGSTTRYTNTDPDNPGIIYVTMPIIPGRDYDPATFILLDCSGNRIVSVIISLLNSYSHKHCITYSWKSFISRPRLVYVRIKPRCEVCTKSGSSKGNYSMRTICKCCC